MSAVIKQQILFTLLLLAGCSSFSAKPAIPEIPLMLPASLGQQWQISQALQLLPTSSNEATIATKPTPLLVAWSVSDKRLDIVGLTPAGQTLIKLSYDGDIFIEKFSPILKQQLDGRAIMAQLQLAYWPLDVINEGFKNSLWQLKAAGEKRSLYYDKNLVLDISSSDYAQGLKQYEIINYLMRYRIEITTLSQTLLP